MKTFFEYMEKLLTENENNTRPLPQTPLEVKYETNHFKMAFMIALI